MSESFVLYRKATEWFEEGKTVIALLSREEADLDEREAEWTKERLERLAKISQIKCTIRENYGRKESVQQNKKTISNYKKRITEEGEIMNKLEYATKCLDFIKSEMIKDASRFTNQQLDILGLNECKVGDALSKSITLLCEFLEGTDNEKLRRGEDNAQGFRLVYDEDALLRLPRLERQGKFIKNVDGEVVEDNFPSIFELKREGFSPDEVIGLAHLQFIGGIRDDGQVQFNWVPESKDGKGRFLEGYWGVTFPPEYFVKNDHEYELSRFGRDWRYTILDEKPAKMHVGDYSQYQHISSMEDILEDGRLYDNRFGIRYDSIPNKVYWEFDTSQDDY